MDQQREQRDLFAFVYSPGRDYGLNRSATASDTEGTDRVFSQALPTFRAFFATFIVTPPQQ